MKKFLSYLILFAALSVSGSAAFYSVFGLSKLFAGASFQVMIMAGSLEFAKLVMATALHRYWKTINKWMRAYLMMAVCVLICITSAGIYGFLSSAYQVTAVKDDITTKEINILEMKKTRFTDQHAEYVSEKGQIIDNISELRKSLSNPNQVQFVDRKTGQLVTTSSEGARKSLETQLKDAISRRDLLSVKIEAMVDSIATMDISIVEAQSNSEISNELGPLKYLSGLTGKPMDTVVNWFLLLLIFVFDPLAVMLIVLANYSFEQAYGKHAWDVIRNKPDPVISGNKPPEIKSEPEINPAILGNENDSGRIIVSNNDISKTIEKSISENKPDLTDKQRKNMTHQEIEQWYQDNSL